MIPVQCYSTPSIDTLIVTVVEVYTLWSAPALAIGTELFVEAESGTSSNLLTQHGISVTLSPIANNGAVWLSIPYIRGKTVSQIDIRIKNDGGTIKSASAEVLMTRDWGLAGSKGSASTGSLSPGTWGDIQITNNWYSDINNEHMKIRIYGDTIGFVAQITTVMITYL